MSDGIGWSALLFTAIVVIFTIIIVGNKIDGPKKQKATKIGNAVDLEQMRKEMQAAELAHRVSQLGNIRVVNEKPPAPVVEHVVEELTPRQLAEKIKSIIHRTPRNHWMVDQHRHHCSFETVRECEQFNHFELFPLMMKMPGLRIISDGEHKDFFGYWFIDDADNEHLNELRSVLKDYISGEVSTDSNRISYLGVRGFTKINIDKPLFFYSSIPDFASRKFDGGVTNEFNYTVDIHLVRHIDTIHSGHVKARNQYLKMQAEFSQMKQNSTARTKGLVAKRRSIAASKFVKPAAKQLTRVVPKEIISASKFYETNADINFVDGKGKLLQEKYSR